MKNRIVAVAAALLLTTSLAVAETAPRIAKSYRVTGPVIELTDTMIVVQGDEARWEIARNKDTKVTGELAVGAKVTIAYQMTAVGIRVKAKRDKKK